MRPSIIPAPVLCGVIAIIDDDASILRALERALLAYGYRVQGFTSAEKYLEEINGGQVACAVVDIHLGGAMSGLELGKRITSSVHATPVVFMSGSNSPAIWRRAMDIGCVEFLEKPFLASRLVGAIMKSARPRFR